MDSPIACISALPAALRDELLHGWTRLDVWLAEASVSVRRAVETVVHGIVDAEGRWDARVPTITDSPWFREAVPGGIYATLTTARKVLNAHVHAGKADPHVGCESRQGVEQAFAARAVPTRSGRSEKRCSTWT